MALNGSSMMYSSKASRLLPGGSKETAITIAQAEWWDFSFIFCTRERSGERFAQRAPRREEIESSDSAKGPTFWGFYWESPEYQTASTICIWISLSSRLAKLRQPREQLLLAHELRILGGKKIKSLWSANQDQSLSEQCRHATIYLISHHIPFLTPRSFLATWKQKPD